MASTTIPNLTQATSLNGSELIWAVQNGADVAVPLSMLLNYVSGYQTTGTGALVLQTSPTINQPTLNGSITNDSAAIGVVGEYQSANILIGGAVNLTINTPANITSLSLTAGDWDVWGLVGFTLGASTSITILQGGVSATSTGIPLVSSGGMFSYEASPTVPGSAASLAFDVPANRFSLSTTTTVYLTTSATFTVSTVGAYGIIQARRRR